jgi:hypothetical protein
MGPRAHRDGADVARAVAKLLCAEEDPAQGAHRQMAQLDCQAWCLIGCSRDGRQFSLGRCTRQLDTLLGFTRFDGAPGRSCPACWTSQHCRPGCMLYQAMPGSATWQTACCAGMLYRHALRGGSPAWGALERCPCSRWQMRHCHKPAGVHANATAIRVTARPAQGAGQGMSRLHRSDAQAHKVAWLQTLQLVP